MTSTNLNLHTTEHLIMTILVHFIHETNNNTYKAHTHFFLFSYRMLLLQKLHKASFTYQANPQELSIKLALYIKL